MSALPMLRARLTYARDDLKAALHNAIDLAADGHASNADRYLVDLRTTVADLHAVSQESPFTREPYTVVARFLLCGRLDLDALDDRDVSLTTQAIRAMHGGAHPDFNARGTSMSCPCCTRAGTDPHRAYIRDGSPAVWEGCIDAHHEGLPTDSRARDWHDSEHGRAYRRATLRAMLPDRDIA